MAGEVDFGRGAGGSFEPFAEVSNRVLRAGGVDMHTPAANGQDAAFGGVMVHAVRGFAGPHVADRELVDRVSGLGGFELVRERRKEIVRGRQMADGLIGVAQANFSYGRFV